MNPMSFTLRSSVGACAASPCSRRPATNAGPLHASAACSRNSITPLATWQRPTPNRDEDFVKPSWVPQPNTVPDFQPSRREEQPLYAPPMPEFTPAERPDQGAPELPSGPKMPERRPDPIPAGNPKKEKPPQETEKREAPPAKTKEAPKQ